MADRASATRLGKILRLWRLYAVMDLIWTMRGLKFFLIYYLSDAILSIAAVTTVFFLAESFDGIGPWTKLQVVFMLGYAMVATGLLEMFFGWNVLVISRRLGRGQLDHLLVQPQPLWMSLLTEGFLPVSGSAIFLLGSGLLAWAMASLDIALSPGWLLMLVVNLCSSAAVVLCFSFLTGSLAFWAPRAAEEISSSSLQMLDQLKPFPLDGLAPLVLGGLLTLLPVGFVAWYPSRFLLGLDHGSWSGIATPVAALVMIVITSWVFSKGLKRYGRTGSQRYLGFGHRR